jgi:hypothetical protein
MVIVFGTRFCGKIAQHNGHWIESKFFSIMFVPLFPVDSMFVTGASFRERQGFSIAVNKKSVFAVYGRILSMFFAGYFLFSAYVYFAESYMDWIAGFATHLTLGLAFAALCVYFYFFFGKATDEDIVLRNKMGHLTGYYILPLFDYGQLRNMLGSLELTYKQKYPDTNWKDDLKSGNIEPQQHMLFFGLALFNCMVYDIPENDELFAIADKLTISSANDRRLQLS